MSPIPMPSFVRRLLFVLLAVLPVTAAASTKISAPAKSRPVRATPRGTTPAPAKAPAARLYLSWNAPFGTARAKTAIAAPCGDSTAADTLYLSFDPGQDAPGFVGATALLAIQAPEGTELPARWRQGTPTAPPVRVSFEADPDRGFETPWSPKGYGAPRYDVVGDRGRLQLVYAIVKDTGPGVRAGKLYGIARVIVPRSPAGADGCAAPLCIEWVGATLAYAQGDERPVKTGERWVSMNSAGRDACARARSSVKPWQPPQGR